VGTIRIQMVNHSQPPLTFFLRERCSHHHRLCEAAGEGGSATALVVGVSMGGLVGLAGLSAAGAGAGFAAWKLFHAAGATPQAASALQGANPSSLTQNALFQSPVESQLNPLAESAV